MLAFIRGEFPNPRRLDGHIGARKRYAGDRFSERVPENAKLAKILIISIVGLAMSPRKQIGFIADFEGKQMVTSCSSHRCRFSNGVFEVPTAQVQPPDELPSGRVEKSPEIPQDSVIHH